MNTAYARMPLEHLPSHDHPDPDNSSVDALTGTLSRKQFERSLTDYDSDQATLLIFDIDHFGEVVEEFGSEVADRILTVTADRLMTGCRRTDKVARIDTDSFAVLLGDIDRATGLQIATRLLAAVATPLLLSSGPESIVATAALSHQSGLVDTDELFESATASLESGKRTGRGRLFVAD